MDRLRQLIETQLGNMVMRIAELTILNEQLTAERDALKAELDKVKTPEPDGDILSPV